MREITAAQGRLFIEDDPDERLIVSPDVMACLENDFPDAARCFRVDPVAEERQRLPMRYIEARPWLEHFLDIAETCHPREAN